MRLDPDGSIVLSRRNLLALLTKLDWPDSKRTIVGGTDAPGVVIRAEDDRDHYRDRDAGEMHEKTEAAIAAYAPLNTARGGCKL